MRRGGGVQRGGELKFGGGTCARGGGVVSSEAPVLNCSRYYHTYHQRTKAGSHVGNSAKIKYLTANRSGCCVSHLLFFVQTTKAAPWQDSGGGLPSQGCPRYIDASLESHLRVFSQKHRGQSGLPTLADGARQRHKASGQKLNKTTGCTSAPTQHVYMYTQKL